MLSFRAFQVKGQVTAQRVGRGEGFAEVDQEVLGADTVDDGEEYCGRGIWGEAATDRRDAMEGGSCAQVRGPVTKEPGIPEGIPRTAAITPHSRR